MAYVERGDAGDDERREDEVGGVRDRRQRVGREHRQARDARQALVMRERRRNRFADEESFERERGVVRHPRASPMDASRCASVKTPTGLADGLGLGMSSGQRAPVRPDYSGPPHPASCAGFSHPNVIMTGLEWAPCASHGDSSSAGAFRASAFAFSPKLPAGAKGSRDGCATFPTGRVEVVARGRRRRAGAVRARHPARTAWRARRSCGTSTLPSGLGEAGFKIRDADPDC